MKPYTTYQEYFRTFQLIFPAPLAKPRVDGELLDTLNAKEQKQP